MAIDTAVLEDAPACKASSLAARVAADAIDAEVALAVGIVRAGVAELGGDVENLDEGVSLSAESIADDDEMTRCHDHPVRVPSHLEFGPPRPGVVLRVVNLGALQRSLLSPPSDDDDAPVREQGRRVVHPFDHQRSRRDRILLALGIKDFGRGAFFELRCAANDEHAAVGKNRRRVVGARYEHG